MSFVQQVPQSSVDRIDQMKLRARGKQAPGAGACGRGRGRGGRGRGARAQLYTAEQWAEWEEWDRIEDEWVRTPHFETMPSAKESEPIKKSKPGRKKATEAAEEENNEPIEKSKPERKKKATEAAEDEEENNEPIEKSKPGRKKKATEAAEEEDNNQPIEKSKSKPGRKKKATEAAEEENKEPIEKSKPSRKKKATEEGEPVAKRRRVPAENGEKASFAGRYRPGVRPFECARWDAIKEAFETHIKPKTATPSMYEACLGNSVYALLGFGLLRHVCVVYVSLSLFCAPAGAVLDLVPQGHEGRGRDRR